MASCWDRLDQAEGSPGRLGWCQDLAICRAFKVFSYHNLDRSSIVGGLNEKVSGPSIASWQLVDWLSLSSCVFVLFLDTFSIVVSVDVVFLDTFLDRWLDTSRHLYRSRITEALYIGLSWSGFHFLDLSRSICSYSPPKHFLLPLKLQPTWFSAFPYFKSLGMRSFSLILHTFHAFRPRFWGFWKFFGGFQN